VKGIRSRIEEPDSGCEGYKVADTGTGFQM
jgi:hypothetical protein